MASVIKRRVIEQLAAWLTDIVDPEIPAADVVIGEPGADEHACFPHLVVRHQGTYEFQAFEEDEMWATDGTHLTQPNVRAVQVGDLSGQIEIRLGTTNQPLREKLEDRILHAFLASQNYQGFGRPGVHVEQLDAFVVNERLNLAQVPVGYAVTTEAWIEEMVFEKKRFSSLMLDVDMPAIVIRTDVYDIDTLVLAITDDLTSEDPALSDVQLSVSEDGEITPYNDPP